MKKLLLIPLLLIQNVSAQADEGEKVPGFVRLLAVGENPTWKTERRGDMRVQLPPPPGSIPPRLISISGAKDPGDGLKLDLSRMTPWVEVTDNKLAIQVSEITKGENAGSDLMKNWAKAPAPKRPLLALYIKNPTADKLTWEKPVRFDFDESLQAFPNESIRIINLTKKDLAVKLGEKSPVKVSSGKHRIFKQADGASLPETFIDVRQIAAPGKYLKVAAKEFDLLRNHRVTLVIHMGDREQTRKDIRMRVFAEPSRVPTPK